MPMIVERDTLPSTCGVECLFDYYFREDDEKLGCWGEVPIKDTTIGGIGYAVAGFINSPDCRQAYEEMCERFHLEYQSPVKKNPNSGNNFFFCIFRNK